MTQITVHMVVKNEDQWVRYSLLSILPYVDMVLITDTGSTDHTVQSIKTLASPKIKLTSTTANSPTDVTRVRQKQLMQTQSDWFWVVDGDEIYPEATAREVVRAIKSGLYEGVTVRRYDLLGDIYHRQKQTVGSYQMWGETGHLVLRALNKTKLPGLNLRGDYPREGYYDQFGVAVIAHSPAIHYITKNYLYHAMYLKRSSLGGNLPMFNRSKYKVELGMPISSRPPSVFRVQPLSWEGDPKKSRSRVFIFFASLITPLKNLKRKLI